MRTAAIVLLWTALSQPLVMASEPRTPTPAEAGAGATADRAGSDVNLIAFVGKRIRVRHVERKAKPNVWILDDEYLLRYQVLEVVFGTYTKKQIEFSSYIHIGTPAWEKSEYSLIYVSQRDGRFVQQKYLYQPVYPTSDGRWAGCGDPYASGMPGSGVSPEPITFKPPVVFQVGKIQDFQVQHEYPAPMFRREGETVICLMGSYPDALFRVMKEGYLTARGVFGPPRHERP